jgi:hypothetical protein
MRTKPKFGFCYKVVSVDNRSLLLTKYTIKYIFNRWNFPRIGKIFCFEGYPTTKQSYIYRSDKLLYCLALNLEPGHIKEPGLCYSEHIDELWNNYKEWDLVENTLFADAVYPICRAEDEKLYSEDDMNLLAAKAIQEYCIIENNLEDL